MSTETQAKHLDGPWQVLIGVCKIDHPHTSADVRGPGNEFIANCGCHDFAIANARLIAEAPAMLDELQNAAANLETILDLIDGYVDVVDGDYGQPAPNKAMRAKQCAEQSLDALQKIVAKVEGRAS